MHIQLERFEGPLALLLFLIRKEEMNIYDIPITRVTQQYLEYLKQLQTIDLEQAGDFVAMAATLIQIKAKMLLPNYNDDGEIIEEDPRKPLVQKLLEYQKYQDAGKQLYDRPLLNRDVWKRGSREEINAEEGQLLLEENALFALITMYRGIIKKANKATHHVASKLQTIASRILEMSKKLMPGHKVELNEFMDGEDFSIRRWVITFLSSLELGKLGYVYLTQEENCGPLFVEAKKEVTGDIIAHVEEYEYVERNQAPPPPLASSSALTAQEQLTFIEDLRDETPVPETPLAAPRAETTEEEFVGVDAATDEEIFAAEQELAKEFPEMDV